MFHLMIRLIIVIVRRCRISINITLNNRTFSLQMNDDAMNNVANLIGECKNCFTMGHGSILYTPSKATLDTGFCRLIVLTAGSVCQLRHTTSTWMLGLADLNVTCSLHAMPNLQFPSMEGKTVTKGITLHPWSTEILDWSKY